MTTVAESGSGASSSGARPAAGWIGSLADTPFAEVLRRIALEERSGDLQVTSPDAVKTVYFDRGFVVFASSDLQNDRLGESMIEAGRISRREFAIASMLMKDGRRKFGQALVQAGILSEEELGRWVGAQVNRIVLSLFSVKRGMYSFDERPSNIPVELMVSLSIYRILLEGIRRMSSRRLILAGLGGLDVNVRLVDDPPFTLDLRKLRPIERAVIRATEKPTTVSSIVRRVGADNGAVLRACYSLRAGGLLEAVGGALDRPTRIQEETGTFVLSEIRRKVEDVHRRRLAAEPAPSPPPTVDALPSGSEPPFADTDTGTDTDWEPDAPFTDLPHSSGAPVGAVEEATSGQNGMMELELTPVDEPQASGVDASGPPPAASAIELIEEVLGDMPDDPIVELVEDALPAPQPMARSTTESEPDVAYPSPAPSTEPPVSGQVLTPAEPEMPSPSEDVPSAPLADLGGSVIGPDESPAAYVFEPILRPFRALKAWIQGWLGRGRGKTTPDLSAGPTREKTTVSPMERAVESQRGAAASVGVVDRAEPEPEAAPKDDEVGIPSWSMVDDPADPAPPEVETSDPDAAIGSPEWSLHDGPGDADATPTSSTLGVPSWSMRDDPAEASSAPPEEPLEAPPKSSRLATPAASESARLDEISAETAVPQEAFPPTEPDLSVPSSPVAPIEEEPPLLEIELEDAEEDLVRMAPPTDGGHGTVPGDELLDPVQERHPQLDDASMGEPLAAIEAGAESPAGAAPVDPAMDMDLVIDLDMEALEGLSMMEQLPVEEIDLAAPSDEIEIELPEELFRDGGESKEVPVAAEPLSVEPPPVERVEEATEDGLAGGGGFATFSEASESGPSAPPEEDSPFVFTEEPLSLDDTAATTSPKTKRTRTKKTSSPSGRAPGATPEPRRREATEDEVVSSKPAPEEASLGAPAKATKPKPKAEAEATKPKAEPKPVPGHVSLTPLSSQPGKAEETKPEPAASDAPGDPAFEVTDPVEHQQLMLRMKQSGGESRIVRDVKLHFKMRDWEGAVPLLEQLVAISPGKALYRGMLARAMSHHPQMRKNAEEHFVQALRLAPQDAELHYWLGLYYKSFGLKSRASHEFRTTLRISPNHQGARKQLGGAKKDDALGNVFKKLFG